MRVTNEMLTNLAEDKIIEVLALIKRNYEIKGGFSMAN